MQTFQGFSGGKPRTISLPTEFITELLPLIDDLAVLKVVLFTFYIVQQREGKFRYARLSDYAQDSALRESLHVINSAREPHSDTLSDAMSDILSDALAKAVAQGALLHAEITLHNGTEQLYFINAEPGRVAIMQINAGHWQAGDDQLPVEILPERPNIYRLYEENIGALTPLIVDALKDAEKEYPQGWVEEAIQLAVEKNARNWRFIAAVLKRREAEGNNGGSAKKPAEQDAEWYLPR